METRLSLRLKTLRKEFSLSPSQVVNKLKKINFNYSEQSVYKWEQGKSIPPLDTTIYNCSISYLLVDESENYKKVNSSDIKVLKLFRTDFLFRSILSLMVRLLNKK